jgi:dolichol-phosphate mannosyltransferase
MFGLQCFTLSAAKFAIMAAIINNFTLNNQFTFKKHLLVRRFEKFKSLALFIGYSIAMVSLQSYWLHLGLKYLGSGYLKENMTMITGIILGSFLNYLTYSRIIWRLKKS